MGGGDLGSNSSADAATSEDGGRTWTLTNKPPVQGAIFCLAYAKGMRLRDDEDDREDDYDRTVVITAETAPLRAIGMAHSQLGNPA